MRKTLIVLATSLALATISAIPAFAKSGKVKETTGHGIVGMWVEVEGGRSGWAKLTGGEAGTSYEKTGRMIPKENPLRWPLGTVERHKNGKNLFIATGSILITDM